MTGGGWLRLLIFCAILVARSSASGREISDSVDRVVPPGQEELLANMLGRGVVLPGNCLFAGGSADGAIVTSEYACDDGKLVVELRPLDDAPRAVLRTAQFAIVARNGSAPPGMLEALAALIRSREAGLEWQTVPRLPFAPLGFAAGVCGIVGIALLAQYLAARGRAPAPGQARQQTSFGRRLASSVSTLHCCGRRGSTLPSLSFMTLVSAYLLTRLSFLTRLPVFVDESIHIGWAQAPFGHYFTPEVSVGKWLPIQVMAFSMFLPLPPLVCVRLASVSMGLATLLACLFINRELFSVGEGLLASTVYALFPFSLLYDRLALADIYLTAFGAWSVFFSLSMIRHRGAVFPLAMSLFTSAAILSKPTGGLFLVIPLLVSVLLVPRGGRAVYLGRSAPTLIGGSALLLFLLRGGYGTDLLGSQSELAGMGLLVANLNMSRQWLTALLTPAVVFSTVAAAAWGLVGIFRGRKADAFLVALLLFAFIPYALVSRVWFPRYLLFVTVPVSLLLARTLSVCTSGAARAADRLGVRLPFSVRPVLVAGAMLVFVLATAPCDLALMTAPERACLPPIDRDQYISGWTSGYGLPELAAFLREQALVSPINVVRFDYAGPPNQGLDVYLDDTNSTRIHTIGHPDSDSALRMAKLAAERRTLFISSPGGEEREGIVASGHVGKAVRIWDYVRPDSESALEVWEVARSQEAP